MSAPGGPQVRTHAMLPTPLVMPDRIRVYYASCDDNLRGRIFWVDLRRDDPTQIMAHSGAPALDLGGAGAFDCDGVNPSHIVARNGALFLYYIGWQRRSAEVPYTLLMGLARSDDGGAQFHRVSLDPILPPVTGEAFFRTAGHVFAWRGGWAMLYIGGGDFFTGASGKRLPRYDLRVTVSDDGWRWNQPGKVVLAPDPTSGEIGFGRPVLWHDNGAVVILLSVRTENGYRLVSLATGREQAEGWQELLEPSSTGWDSEMTCFGAPCCVNDNEFLFYNGNRFGHTGFGVAQRPAQPFADGDAPLVMTGLRPP